MYGRIPVPRRLPVSRLLHTSGPVDLLDHFAEWTIAQNTQRHVKDSSSTCLWSLLLPQLWSGFDNQFLVALWLFTLLRLFVVLWLGLLALRMFILRLLSLRLVLLARQLLSLRLALVPG
jgi:hypothetical protein